MARLSVQQVLWLLTFFVVLAWSGIGPKDYLTWALEVVPAVIGLILILMTRQKFPLTPLLYLLILAHSIILMVGGHYTYAEVPLFDWIADVLEQGRNNYDKVGHFAQGFIPVVLARELLIRLDVVNGRHWTHFLAVSCCLAFSAFYELIEWFVASLSDEAADAFLGTQGYVWDTQSDMAFALVGAIAGVVLLARLHDKQIGNLQAMQVRGPGVQ